MRGCLGLVVLMILTAPFSAWGQPSFELVEG